MSEAETKTIVGQCVSIDQRPGSDWVEFKINTGSQYPTKLSTKVAAVIEQARAMGSEVAAWTFSESDGNPNPHKPGTFYKNRWLTKVEPAAGGAPHAGGSTPVPEAKHDAIAPADKDRSITRMACLKAAATIVAGADSPASDPGLEVMKLAQRFETWIYRDIDVPPSKPDSAGAPAVPDEPPLPEYYAPDDDVPFGDEAYGYERE